MKTTKRILLMITLGVVMICQVRAQDPALDWVVQIGGDTTEYSYSVAVDPFGNTLVTGYFMGTAVFGSGADAITLTSKGKEDIFIQKVAPDGRLLWAIGMGDTASDKGLSVTIDAAANVYVTGNFRYKMDVDPGTGTFYLECHHDAVFILKLDAGGNLIWAKQMGYLDDFGFAWGNAISVDAGGNVITTGNFIGRIDFDPGIGTFNLTAAGGVQDVFIQKLDANGNFLWADQIKGTASEYSYSIKTDESGNIYLTGYFSGTADFNPAKKGTFNMTSNGGIDIFIEKLDASGNFVWAKQMGGTEHEGGKSLALDGKGNIYTTGYFYGTVDFDPGPGTFNLTPFGKDDCFIQKLDIAGNFKWAKQLGGPSWEGGESVTTDAAGNVYIAGFFYETTDFDPGPGTHYLTSNGKHDIFIYKSDPDGNFQWVGQMGGTSWDAGLSIAIDAFANIYTTGIFGNTVDFDPGGSGSGVLTSNGYLDVFLQKLNQGAICYPPSGLNATNISYYSAILNWNAVAGAESYNVRYRINGSGNWITENGVSLTSFPVNGLIPATVYEFQVQTNCGESLSLFSASATFTTLGPECNDSYEPNETQLAAKTIAVNTDIRALIAVSGDLDWFKFNNTNKNRNIKIILTNLPANYDVALYNAAGVQLGISQNPGNADETITYNTSTVGTYYVKVYGNAGSYNLLSCYKLQASIQQSSWKSLETGINDDGVATNFSVYPNPASTVLNISFSSPINENITLRFTDMTGQTIKVYNFTAVEGMNLYTINLNDFRDGLYFMGMTTGSQNYYRKIIIRK